MSTASGGGKEPWLSSVFVFGRAGESVGNEATVVRCAESLPSEETMRRIAAERATPVSAFISGEREPFPVRFFTSNAELPFCGHGALAAGSMLLRETGASQVRLAAAGSEVIIRSDTPGVATLVMQGPVTVREDFDRQRLLEILGLSEKELDPASPFVIASVGSPKWLVPVADVTRLRELQPRSAELADWSIRCGVNGAYVYTRHGIPQGVHALARAFNPKTGAHEDAATGVAAAPLAWVLRDTWRDSPWFVVDQGIGLRNLNRLRVRISEDQRIHVGGEVKFSQEPMERGNSHE